MFCIGLTGNVASGKSTVLNEFAHLGADIISADKIARELTEPNQPALAKIVDHFGPSILTEAGEMERRQLRTIIFNNKKERSWLEDLLHPLIRKKIKERIDESHGFYCVIEIPLLPDRKDYPYLNRLLFVDCAREQRIIHLMKRDNSSHGEALAILSAQASNAEYKAIADDVLENNGTLAELKQKVEALHKKYLLLSGSAHNKK